MPVKRIDHPDVKLKFYWLHTLESLHQMLEQNCNEFKRQPRTFILGSHFLWSVLMRQVHNKNFNMTEFVAKTENYKYFFISKILPTVAELADSGNRFLWASIEHRADFTLETKILNEKNITYTVLRGNSGNFIKFRLVKVIFFRQNLL